MASSLEIQKMSHHARSISLPTDSHPLTLLVEEQLCRLRSSSSSSSSSTSSICQNLLALQDLYESVDDLLKLPLAHQSLSSKQIESLKDQVLDGSIKLLDVCGNTRDILSQMRQSMQDLQSSLRRRGRESDVATEVCSYMTTRKKGNKLINKCLSDIKKNQSSLLSSNINGEDMLCILSEVETITLAVFQSVLSSISYTRSKQSNWSFVSKLKLSRSTSCKDVSELVKVDVELKTIMGQKSCKGVAIQSVLKPLEALESSIQGFEDELDCLFRRLIKIRVSVLNLVNHL